MKCNCELIGINIIDDSARLNDDLMKSTYKLWLKANGRKIKKSQIVVHGDGHSCYIEHLFGKYIYHMNFVFLDYGIIKINQAISKAFDFEQGKQYE